MTEVIESLSNVQTGMITRIHDAGTIIVVFLTSPDGSVGPVCFDRRPFGRLLEGERCSVEDLIGRSATFNGQVIRFMD